MIKIENPYEVYEQYLQTGKFRNNGCAYVVFCEYRERKDLVVITQGLNNALQYKTWIDVKKENKEVEVNIYGLNKNEIIEIVQKYIIEQYEEEKAELQ
jgi:hypothetical protein